MDRKTFLKQIGVGVAAIVVAPKLLTREDIEVMRESEWEGIDEVIKTHNIPSYILVT